MKSLSDKRLIIEGKVNGKTAYFLLDTGASVGLIDKSQKKKYGLKEGRRYPGSIIGGGGDITTSYMCDTLADINGRQVGQFIFSDISGVRDSIKTNTGYEILGIIGLPQMKTLQVKIDLTSNSVFF